MKSPSISHDWQLVDANNKILGRLATKVATVLMGKNKPYYVPYLDCGDYVVIINASKIRLSGKKEVQKSYFRHSGFPGGLRLKKVSDIRSSNPSELIRHAVVGMLPKNKMARIMIKKLYIFDGQDNPYREKFTTKSATTN